MPISDYTDVSGCQLILEASRITGLSDGDPVATWADASGNSRDFSQGTGVNRPTYKTNIINGRAIVRFDGTTDYVQGPNFLTGYTEGEIFVLVKINADPPADVAQSGLWVFGSSGDTTHFPYTDGTVYDAFATDTRKTTVDPTPSLSSTFRIYNVSSKSGEWTSRLDGTQIYTTGTNTVGWTTGPRLGADAGATRFLQGDLALAVLYNVVLSSADRASVIDKINTDYFGASFDPSSFPWPDQVHLPVRYERGVVAY